MFELFNTFPYIPTFLLTFIVLFDLARYNLYLGRYEPFLEYAPRYLAVNPNDKEFRKLYDDIVAGARPVVPADETPPGGESGS